MEIGELMLKTMNRIHALLPLQEVGKILVYRFQNVDDLLQAEHVLQAQFMGQDNILRVNGNTISVTGSLMRENCELMIHVPDDGVAESIKEVKEFAEPHRECGATRRALLGLKTKEV